MKRLMYWCLPVVVFGTANPFVRATTLEDAERTFTLRADPAQAAAAFQLYEQAVLDKPTEGTYWKAARAGWWAAQQNSERNQRLIIYLRAQNYADKAIAINAQSAEGHFWKGLTMGAYGEDKGVLKSLALLDPIRKEMKKVLEINPTFMGCSAYRVLGVMDYKVPKMMGGDKKRAGEQLQKTLACAPNDPFTHYYLAEYYEEIGKKDDAKRELMTLDTLTVSDDFKPEHELTKKKAEVLRRRLK